MSVAEKLFGTEEARAESTYKSIIATLTGDAAGAADARASRLEKKADAARAKVESLGAKAAEAKAKLTAIVSGEVDGDAEKVAGSIVDFENTARAAVYEADALAEAATAARKTAGEVAVRVKREQAEATAAKQYSQVAEIEDELHGRLAAIVDLVERGEAINRRVLADTGLHLDQRAFSFDRPVRRIAEEFEAKHQNDTPNGAKWAEIRWDFRASTFDPR